MAHRHRQHKRAHGGRTVYEGAGSNTAKEAEERKHGGGTKHHKGKHAMMAHEKSHKRMDRRARGGGCDTHPFSSAHIKG